MKKFLFVSIFSTLPTALFAAQVVNVKYIHDYIKAKEGITLAAKETKTTKAANMKYLLCAIDKANATVSGCPATTYCTNARATTQAVDTTAVANAVASFVKTGVPVYQIVDYVTFTKTQYFDTGQIAAYNTTRIETEYKLTNITDKTKQQVLIGGRSESGTVDSDGLVYFPLMMDGTDGYFDYWGADRTAVGAHTTNWRSLKIDGAKFYLDNMTTPKTTMSPARSGNSVYSMYFGAVHDATNPTRYFFNGQARGLKIYKSNSLVLDWVPVKRISDGKYGYYDRVSKAFKTNLGTGSIGGSTTITGYLTSAGATACQ